MLITGRAYSQSLQTKVSRPFSSQYSQLTPSPYDILDLPINATDADIKKQYRKKSLMIHPDKFKHEHGMEVSPVLSFALQTLTDRLLT